LIRSNSASSCSSVSSRAVVRGGAFQMRHLRDLQIAFSLHQAHEETGLYRWARSRHEDVLTDVAVTA